MSLVSGVTLQFSCAEDYVEYDGAPDSYEILNSINVWLISRGFEALARVEDWFSGSKHPQVIVAGGGFNYFPEEEFAAYIFGLNWLLPPNVVLRINTESGPTKIFRFSLLERALTDAR